MNNKKELIISIAIPLILALISTLGINFKEIYLNIGKPPLAPPPIIFPIVWTILYILMGISEYLIKTSNHENKEQARTFYYIQLAINIIWPILFFRFQAFALAFLWIILLIIILTITIIKFYKINKTAAYLLIPYLLWIIFATYLNLSIYLLN